MRVGCAAYSFRQYLQSGKLTLEDFLEKCVDMGLNGVELTAYYFPSTEDSYLHSLKKRAYLLGLDISGSAVGNNFCVADSAKRAEQVAMVKKWLEISVKLGAPCMRVFAGSVPSGHTEEEAKKWTVDAIKECAEVAEKLGVILALENHGGITSTAVRTVDLVKSVDSDWVKINLDTGNYREDPYVEIEYTTPYAVTAHAKTEMRDKSGQKIEADFGKIVKILNGCKYKGYLSIEYEAAEDPMTAVPRFAQRLKSLVEA